MLLFFMSFCKKTHLKNSDTRQVLEIPGCNATRERYMKCQNCYTKIRGGKKRGRCTDYHSTILAGCQKPTPKIYLKSRLHTTSPYSIFTFYSIWGMNRNFFLFFSSYFNIQPNQQTHRIKEIINNEFVFAPVKHIKILIFDFRFNCFCISFRIHIARYLSSLHSFILFMCLVEW